MAENDKLSDALLTVLSDELLKEANAEAEKQSGIRYAFAATTNYGQDQKAQEIILKLAPGTGTIDLEALHQEFGRAVSLISSGKLKLMPLSDDPKSRKLIVQPTQSITTTYRNNKRLGD